MGFEHLPAQAQKEGLVLPQAGRKGSPQCSEVAGKPQPGLFQLGLQIQLL